MDCIAVTMVAPNVAFLRIVSHDWQLVGRLYYRSDLLQHLRTMGDPQETIRHEHELLISL